MESRAGIASLPASTCHANGLRLWQLSKANQEPDIMD
jgi:hypothetical protein